MRYYYLGKVVMKAADHLERIQWVARRALLVALGAVLGFVVCAKLYQREAIEKDRVERFVAQIVESVTHRTDFYATHSTDRGLKGLQLHAKLLTNFYKTDIFDKTFNAYECRVSFDNGKEFYVDVLVFKNDIKLNEWSLIPDDRSLPSHADVTRK